MTSANSINFASFSSLEATSFFHLCSLNVFQPGGRADCREARLSVPDSDGVRGARSCVSVNKHNTGFWFDMFNLIKVVSLLSLLRV